MVFKKTQNKISIIIYFKKWWMRLDTEGNINQTQV